MTKLWPFKVLSPFCTHLRTTCTLSACVLGCTCTWVHVYLSAYALEWPWPTPLPPLRPSNSYPRLGTYISRPFCQSASCFRWEQLEVLSVEIRNRHRSFALNSASTDSFWILLQVVTTNCLQVVATLSPTVYIVCQRPFVEEIGVFHPDILDVNATLWLPIDWSSSILVCCHYNWLKQLFLTFLRLVRSLSSIFR